MAKQDLGLSDALSSSRPFSWINTAAPFALGAALSGSFGPAAIIGTLYFLWPYNLLMYGVNDIYDYESDIKNPRKGASIEGAVIARSRHKRLARWIALINLPFLAYLALSGPAASRWWLLLTVFMAVAYSLKGLRFKEIPLLDSITSSTHFFAPFVYGLLLTQGAIPSAVWPGLAAFALWGVASHAFGAVQDVLYDREAKIGSIATVIGARATVRLATVVYLLAAIVCGLAYSVAGAIAGILVALYAVNTARFWNTTDTTSPATNRGWRVFLWLNLAVGFGLTQLFLWQLGAYSLLG